MSVFIVAELSGNHHRSMQTALDLVHAAHEAGADAIKVQTLKPETIAAAGVVIPSGPWKGRELRDLYQEIQLPWEWHARIFDEARSLGMEPFSSPFDPEAVAFLETLGVKRYKVASPEVTDYPLLRAIAATGKPVLLSDGMASKDDLWQALRALRHGLVTVLRCVSEYPASSDSFRLGEFADSPWNWGVSDHTMPPTVAIAATALGASVIEKHLTLSRASGGADAGFSQEPHEFKQMVQMVREAELAMVESPMFRPLSSHHWLRKSLHVTKIVTKGEVVSEANVRALRPGTGCDPFLWPKLEGGRFLQDYTPGPLRLEMVLPVESERNRS